MKIFKTRTANESYSANEKSVCHFIPYKCHWDRNTILTKKNGLLQIIKLGGFSFETADDEDVDLRKNLRNSLFKNMASGNVTIYFHTIRTLNKQAGSNYYNDSAEENVSDNFVNYLTREWQKKTTSSDSYFNELYISILYEPDTEGTAFVSYLVKKLMQTSSNTAWANDMREMHSNLKDMSDRVINSLKEYDPLLLGVVETEGGIFCEMTEFLGRLANCGEISTARLPRGNIDEYITTNRLFFDQKTIESRGAKGTRFAGIVSVKEYGPSTNSGIFDGFLQMPFEFIMTQSFKFSNRTVAIGKMQLQQNRMIQAEDKAVSQIAEISQALDMAMGGEIGFGEHHISILCIDKSVKALENNLSAAEVELSNCGMQTVKERINLEPSYWGQLPGNIDYIVRRATINTLNLAGFASMHNYPTGKKYGNFWGEYVTTLETTSGTSYYFNFHVRDVGHTLIIGPTGSGKTVLMNFLCAQAQKFRPRMFFFDKDRGAEIFIRALEGNYTVIDPRAGCSFNPLQLPDTSENRNFLLEWLKALVTCNGDKVTTEEVKVLSQAIEGNYRLDKRDRKLSNIAPFLGIATAGSLASRLEIWHSKGSHAKVFDNNEDNINFNTARVFGFEMAQLLKDPIALPPVLLYIFHRINLSLDGSRNMIVLDEAWALLDNHVFAPIIKDWLKVLRKLNTFVIFATQSVEDASKSSISDTLIQQTATQIFLPNLKATEVYRTAFMLSQREYMLIKSTSPSSRYFLLKQGLNAIVAKVNLSGMDNIVNVLSGRAETVSLLKNIMSNYGTNPQKWLPIFYKESKNLH
jgi:type IV secretion system protein VirB4